jgi:hypothetical protein
MAADAWLKTLGVSDPLQYCPDWRIQLGMMADSVATESEQLRAMADAGKAGFASLEIAAVHLSFFNPYPETMLKASGDKAHAATDGRTFVATFATATIYEGDAAFSPKKEFERVLEHNRDKFQAGIDMMFPPDHPGQAKTNAVFSHVLRKGYSQAKSFLESLMPFSKMMTQAGLSEEEGWQKVLTYVTAVCKRVKEVRTTVNIKHDGARLYGMLLSLDLLDAFSDLDWIRHPDVSSALVVAALQKDGKAVQEALALLAKHVTQINTNKNKTYQLETELKNLKRLNPNLKTA